MSEVLSKFSCDHIPEGDSCGLVVTLVEQNAKLRKLVRDWRELAVCGADSLSDWIEIQADLESRMRELGIEADG